MRCFKVRVVGKRNERKEGGRKTGREKVKPKYLKIPETTLVRYPDPWLFNTPLNGTYLTPCPFHIIVDFRFQSGPISESQRLRAASQSRHGNGVGNTMECTMYHTHRYHTIIQCYSSRSFSIPKLTDMVCMVSMVKHTNAIQARLLPFTFQVSRLPGSKRIKYSTSYTQVLRVWCTEYSLYCTLCTHGDIYGLFTAPLRFLLQPCF